MRREKDIEIQGANPFDEELKGKIKALEAFQTERTAKEFYDAVQKIFRHYNILPSRPWFGEKLVFLTFGANEDEAVVSQIDRLGERVASYVSQVGNLSKDEKNIFVGAVPAYRIPSLDERKKAGEISPLEEMPISIGINEMFQHLFYD